MARKYGFPLLLICIALVGMGHSLVRTSTYGAAVWPDSTTYVSAAMNFLDGAGLKDFAGQNFTVWPPLFPLLLASLNLFGLEPAEGGRLANAAAFGLTILACGFWLRRHLRSRPLALLAVASMAASLPLNHLAALLLTEPLFILFAMLALMRLERFLSAPDGAWRRRTLLAAALFTALAATIRYPGATLIFVGVLLLLLQRRPIAAKLKQATAFGFIASAPLAMVLARNWILDGSPFGPRFPSSQTFADSLSQLSQIAASASLWILPGNVSSGAAYALWTTAGLALTMSAAIVLLRLQADPERGALLASWRLGALAPFALFVLLYLAFLSITVRLVQQPIDQRYLAPTYLPLLLIGVFLLDRIAALPVAGWMAVGKRVSIGLILMGALAHIALSARANLLRTAAALESGYTPLSYNARHWQESETLAHLQAHPPDGAIFSTNTYAVWWRSKALASQREYIWLNNDYWHCALDQAENRPEDSYIVQFRQDAREGAGCDRFYDYLPGIEPLAKFSDGGLYRVPAGWRLDARGFSENLQRHAGVRVGQEPVVRSVFDIYLDAGSIRYVREPCTAQQAQAPFFLHLVPVALADLPEHRQPYGFDDISFAFQDHGHASDGRCSVEFPLPDYRIAAITTGQFRAEGDFWKEHFSFRLAMELPPPEDASAAPP